MSTRVTEIAPAALDYRDAARFLGVSVSSLRRSVKDGSVVGVPLMGRTVFRVCDLREVLNDAANRISDEKKGRGQEGPQQ